MASGDDTPMHSLTRRAALDILDHGGLRIWRRRFEFDAGGTTRRCRSTGTRQNDVRGAQSHCDDDDDRRRVYTLMIESKKFVDLLNRQARE